MTSASCTVCSGFLFFFSSRRRHTRFKCDWSSDVCSSDLFLCSRFYVESPRRTHPPLRKRETPGGARYDVGSVLSLLLSSWVRAQPFVAAFRSHPSAPPAWIAWACFARVDCQRIGKRRRWVAPE